MHIVKLTTGINYAKVNQRGNRETKEVLVNFWQNRLLLFLIEAYPSAVTLLLINTYKIYMCDVCLYFFVSLLCKAMFAELTACCWLRKACISKQIDLCRRQKYQRHILRIPVNFRVNFIDFFSV